MSKLRNPLSVTGPREQDAPRRREVPLWTSNAPTLVRISCEEEPVWLRVEQTGEGHRLAGEGVDVELANRVLAHSSVRNFAVATCRAETL